MLCPACLHTYVGGSDNSLLSPVSAAVARRGSGATVMLCPRQPCSTSPANPTDNSHAPIFRTVVSSLFNAIHTPSHAPAPSLLTTRYVKRNRARSQGRTPSRLTAPARCVSIPVQRGWLSLRAVSTSEATSAADAEPHVHRRRPMKAAPQSLTTQILERVMKRAQGAQVVLGQSESTPVSFENDKLKSVRVQEGTSVSVRVILDGKVGSYATSDLDDVDSVVTSALEAAEHGSKAYYEFPGRAAALQAVKLFDQGIVNLTKAEMVRMGEEMVALVKQYDSNIVVNAGVTKTAGQLWFVNSAGQECFVESSSYSAGVFGQRTRGTDILWAGDGQGWRQRTLDHVAIARKAVEKFRLAEKNAPMESGACPVVFTPHGAYVLLYPLELGVNGKNVVKGDSPLKGKLGQKIADEQLTIVDDPLIDYASSSGSFDGEGVPHRVTPIVKDGVLASFLYDLDAAGRAGTTSTGHGPGCGTTNVLIEEGRTPYEQMVKSIDCGLLVEGVMGFGQSNIISGAFSVNVSLGYKIEKGQIVGRVKDVMLAGNAYDALKAIAAIGREREWVGGSLLTPAIQVEKLSVVSKK
ncbi:MAG: TldD/PmbA family protein [Planctomycetes bacterium]|nr:TldD/PmbA family protein [Planctomycetota bacterium]